MIDRVLVPTDGSDQSDRACEFVFEEFPGASLVLVHVINPAEADYSARSAVPATSTEWHERQKELVTEYFETIEAAAEEHGVETERHVETGKPTREIVSFVEESDVDHVVMGSRGREGVSRILLGSVAETTVRRSPVPVTVVR